MRLPLACLLVCFACSPAFAQAERYELGRRLKRFEAAWEKQPDADARQRALALLPEITPMFFSLRFGEAGQTLDRARWRLAGQDDPPADVQWLEALYAMPEKQFLTTEKVLKVVVRPFYKVKGDRPAGGKATMRVNRRDPVEVPLAKFPVTVELPLDAPPGEISLTFAVALGDKLVAEARQRIGYAADLAARLDRLRAFTKSEPRAIETATLQDRVELLTELADGTVPETDLPGFELLAEGERVLASPRYFDHTRPGQFWLSVPLAKKKTQPLRLFVPKGLDAKKPVPLVVALHGAGGSENLFFEGYGAGHIMKECERRGWLLVAPRSGLSFGSGPPVKEIVDALADRYPIDRGHIFLVGHSMGAAQVIALAQELPGFFAGVAALGGGGRVKDARPFTALPTFVGVGEKDFARGGATALAKALKEGGTKGVTFKEYPHVEHMAVVRVALPDVFAVWDTVVPKK